MRPLLFLCFLIFALCLSAQDYRHLLGGQFSFSAGNSELNSELTIIGPDGSTVVLPQNVDVQSFGVNLSPYFARRFSDRVLGGIGLAFNYRRFVRESTGSNPLAVSTTINQQTGFGGYLWLRYDLAVWDKLRLYLEPRLGGGGNRNLQTNPDGTAISNRDSKTFYLDNLLGVTYALTERWQLNLRIATAYLRYSENDRAPFVDEAQRLEAGAVMDLRNLGLGVEWRF